MMIYYLFHSKKNNAEGTLTWHRNKKSLGEYKKKEVKKEDYFVVIQGKEIEEAN